MNEIFIVFFNGITVGVIMTYFYQEVKTKRALELYAKKMKEKLEEMPDELIEQQIEKAFLEQHDREIKS